MRIDQWVRYNILASFFNIGLDITIYAHPRLYNIVYTLDSPKNLPARTAWPATKDLQDEDLTETESSQLKELCWGYNKNIYPSEHPDCTPNGANILDRQLNGLPC
jgi:hypothetical protein